MKHLKISTHTHANKSLRLSIDKAFTYSCFRKIVYYGSLIIIANFATLACSVLSPVETPAIQKYTMNTSTHQNTSCEINNNHKAKPSIYIMPTSAIAPYNSIKMFYSYSSYSINQYSQSFWATPPSNYINQNIFNALLNSCTFSQIYTNEFAKNLDYKLATQLVSLQQSIKNNNAIVSLIINIQLINNTTGIIKYKQFTTTTTISPSPKNMAIGASADLQEFATQLVAWINHELT